MHTKNRLPFPSRPSHSAIQCPTSFTCVCQPISIHSHLGFLPNIPSIDPVFNAHRQVYVNNVSRGTQLFMCTCIVLHTCCSFCSSCSSAASRAFSPAIPSTVPRASAACHSARSSACVHRVQRGGGHKARAWKRPGG